MNISSNSNLKRTHETSLNFLGSVSGEMSQKVCAECFSLIVNFEPSEKGTHINGRMMLKMFDLKEFVT